MRLYPKKLRNIEDLEREKKILRKQSRQLEKEEFLSIEGLLSGKEKKKGKNKEEQRQNSSYADMLPIDNPLIKLGLKILEGKLLSGRRNEKKESVAENGSPRKNPIKKVAFEIIGGYLKWKAIELSYKGIKYLIKKQKEKKEAGAQ